MGAYARDGNVVGTGNISVCQLKASVIVVPAFGSIVPTEPGFSH